MTPIFWIDGIAYFLAAVTATGLAMTVLALGPRATLNRLFALFTASEALWAFASLVYRLMLVVGFDQASAEFWLHVATLGMVYMGPLLQMFSSRYTGRRTRWTDVAALAGVVVLGILIVPLFQGKLLFDPYISENGMVVYKVTSPWGFLSGIIPAVYFIWSLVLVWRERRRLKERYIAWGTLIIVAGYAAGGILRPFIAAPVLSITVMFSVVIIGAGIISQQLLNPLRELSLYLEERVEERTQKLSEATEQLEIANISLERRAAYLEAAALVAREAAGIRDVGLLLQRTANLVSESFGFYHVGIFLLDGAGEYAVLHAASSQGGQRMLNRGHRLRVGEAGIVGYVAGTGGPRIALDVGEDAVFFDNPDLPHTRSEMAVPLKVRGEVIGVLDVQSTEPEAFSQEDVKALETLSDQVALAISNARLFEQVEERLEAERRLYGQLSYEEWRALVQRRGAVGFWRKGKKTTPAGDLWQPRMEKALRTGERVEEDSDVLTIPIKVRGQVIGVVDARRSARGGGWTMERVALLEQLVEHLGTALESARLYEEAQHRAAREQLVAEIAGRLRASMDPDLILKTTVRELGYALEAERASVILTGPSGDGGLEGEEEQ